MKSLCIKTNDSNHLNYLLNEFESLDLDNIYFSENKFKNYKNIIIHYKGTNITKFISEISSILSLSIIDEKEETFLKKIIFQNYFYFNYIEQKKILSMCFEIMSNDFLNNFNKKYVALYDSFIDFLNTNKSLFTDGFINFRIKNYMNILEEIVNEAVNNFIIEKEYLEFISLLKLYINSQPNGCNTVHVMYKSSESILLDENNQVILMTKDAFKAKYLSDISFSSNDYTLNSLLTLLPEKIYIHLTDDNTDEFINTLQLIFENRINLCN